MNILAKQVKPRPSPAPVRRREPAGDCEARFQALFEAVTDAVFIETADGRILDCNPTACEIYGYTRAEFLRLNVRDLLPADVLAQLNRVGRKITSKGRLLFETVNKKKDGSLFPCEVSLRLARIGRSNLFVVFVRDLTERRKAERVRNAAFRIAEAAQSAESLDDLFRSIHAVISELMPARNFYIALFDPDRDLLTFPYFIDEFDEPVKPKKPGKGLTEYVLRTGAPLLASPEIFRSLLRRKQIESIGAPSIDWLGVPLKVKGRTIGVMVVQSYAAGVRFTEEDKAILIFVSAQAAMAIQRKRSEEALKSSLREKEVLLREIHHRVKNNLQVVSSLLNLQGRRLKEGEAMGFLKESQRRIRSMALVHEKLYQSKDLARIDMSGYVGSLAQHLFLASRVDPAQVRFRPEIRDVALDINTAMPCGLLISELVSNALKHAFPGNRTGTIAVELRPEGESSYLLVVRDDGAGMPAGLDFRRTDSLGMQLVLLLVEQLDGTIELAAPAGTNGTEFRVRFQELVYK